MNILKKINLSIFIYSILTLALGICLVCMPTQTLLTICYIIGGFAIILGIMSIVEYFAYGSEPFGLVTGLFGLGFGIVFVVMAQQFVNSGIFAVLLGLAILFMGIFKIQEAINAKRAQIKAWWLYIVYSLLMIVLSILLIVNPFDGQKVFLIVLGVTLILDAVCDIIMLIVIGDKLKQIKKTFVPKIVEVTAEETPENPKQIEQKEKQKSEQPKPVKAKTQKPKK